MGFRIHVATAAFLLGSLVNCAPMGEVAPSAQQGQASNANIDGLDESSLEIMAFTRNPLELPPPPPPPQPGIPLLPSRDFVCKHTAAQSLCNSRGTEVDIDYMERFARTENPAFKKKPGIVPGLICLPAKAAIWQTVAGYPVTWLCTIPLQYASSNFDVDTAAGTIASIIEKPMEKYAQRVLAGARPAGGYRSLKHYDAPFRCYGGHGRLDIVYSGSENEIATYNYSRDKMECFFSLNVITAQTLADATAEIEEFKVLEGVKFDTTCTVRTKVIGPALNQHKINVLECTYTLPTPPPGTVWR